MMAFKREGLDEITRMGQEMDNAELPKPVEVIKCGICGLPDMVFRRDYDALAERLAAAEAQRDDCAWMNNDQARRVYQAESKLAAIEKMGREPSKGMVEAVTKAYIDTGEGEDMCKAMFNKMMEELK